MNTEKPVPPEGYELLEDNDVPIERGDIWWSDAFDNEKWCYPKYEDGSLLGKKWSKFTDLVVARPTKYWAVLQADLQGEV
jgi:hypothetical protein